MKEKTKNQKLGTKYFLIFSSMTVFLFLLIIILQAFLTRYLIQKNENDYMLEELKKKKVQFCDFIEYQKKITNKLAENPKIYKKDFLENFRDSTNSISFFLKQENNPENQINLDWLDQLYLEISLNNDDKGEYLIVVDFPAVYSIYYSYIKNDYYKDVLISVTPINNKVLGSYSNFLVVPKDKLKEKKYPDWVRDFLLKKANKIINPEEYHLFIVSNEEAYYFSLLQDYHSDYYIFGYNPYYREVNVFFGKTFVLTGILLFFSLIILIFAFGKWFSIEMIKPVVNLSEKMEQISQNPSKRITLNPDTEGEFKQIIEVFNDMTGSINTYQYSLMQYKLLFDQIKIGFFWLDKDLHLKLYNPEFLNIFELENERVEDRKITDIAPLNDKFFQLIPNYVFSDLEVWLADLNKYISISLQCLLIDEDYVFIGLIADITNQRILNEQRRSLEMELIRINRLAELGRRIQGIVHNLNSPLNSVLGFAQLIEEDNPGNNDIKKVIKSAVSMAQMIKTLLIKIKKDSMSMPDILDLNEFLVLEIENCKHHLFFKNEVKLETSFSPNLPKILTIHGDLSQVFSILFNNAMDAMSSSLQKKLSICSFQTETMIGFSVEDSGCGIPDSNLERIFEPNFTTKKISFSGGYGLGLAIAKSIINKLSGEIKVESTLLKGSCFSIYIPIHKKESVLEQKEV